MHAVYQGKTSYRRQQLTKCPWGWSLHRARSIRALTGITPVGGFCCAGFWWRQQRPNEDFLRNGMRVDSGKSRGAGHFVIQITKQNHHRQRCSGPQWLTQFLILNFRNVFILCCNIVFVPLIRLLHWTQACLLLTPHRVNAGVVVNAKLGVWGEQAYPVFRYRERFSGKRWRTLFGRVFRYSEKQFDVQSKCLKCWDCRESASVLFAVNHHTMKLQPAVA